MRFFSLCLFLTIYVSVSAQKDFVWEEVVKVDSTISQKDLYNRAKLYIATAFVSGKAVTQLNNDDDYTIVIKPSYQAPQIKGIGPGFSDVDGGYVGYTVTLSMKDGRYKYKISDCHHEGLGRIVSCGMLTREKPTNGLWNGGVPNSYWTDILKPAFITYTNSLIKDMKSAMGQNNDKKNDW